MFSLFFFGVFTPLAETENYVLGHFRPNIFGGQIFGASLVGTDVPADVKYRFM
jgi:hypothetical protein